MSALPKSKGVPLMCAFLYPGEYIDSTYHIDFDKLYNEGYRGIIFDIDNTLVPHGAPADERAILLFRHLKELGFKCMLLSNNKEPRVKMFNDAVHVQYIYKAGKPKPAGYRKAMKELGTNAANTLFVGDQIFTDVRCKPRGHPHDPREADPSEGGNPDRTQKKA
jgi:HAD superfamily phosphatase (TIGR01668 family)